MVNKLDKYKLPPTVRVKVVKTAEGSFIAVFPELPGCLTEADNVIDLIYQVNDAIYTYFDVPGKELKGVGLVYTPPQEFLHDMAKLSSGDNQQEQRARKTIEFKSPYFTSCSA
jgi:predicted RNase H-like HicB family nuclease